MKITLTTSMIGLAFTVAVAIGGGIYSYGQQSRLFVEQGEKIAAIEEAVNELTGAARLSRTINLERDVRDLQRDFAEFEEDVYEILNRHAGEINLSATYNELLDLRTDLDALSNRVNQLSVSNAPR